MADPDLDALQVGDLVNTSQMELTRIIPSLIARGLTVIFVGGDVIWPVVEVIEIPPPPPTLSDLCPKYYPYQQ